MTGPVTLQHWLRHLEQQGPAPIALGLERVGLVSRRLWPTAKRIPVADLVLTVGGTNGKGSVVATTDALLRAAGRRVGRYTSPHLRHFNERIVIDGQMVSDEALLQAFEQVEQARGQTDLTYFEFTTLAAFWLFSQARLDVAVLEVGLGGRLDAVNLIDADVAVITGIALDHQSFLGDSREAIGLEKAGIARSGRPLVLGERQPPDGLLSTLQARGARLLQLGRDFDIVGARQTEALLRLPGGQTLTLLAPTLPGQHQWDNLAVATVAVASLPTALFPDRMLQQRAQALLQLPGRLQPVPAPVPTRVDVAHNPQAAAALAQWWSTQPGPRHAVFGLLADKDLSGVIKPLLPLVDVWHPIQLQGPRARPVSEIVAALRQAGAVVEAGGDRHLPAVWDKLQQQLEAAPAGSNVVAFGSFLLVADVLELTSPVPA